MYATFLNLEVKTYILVLKDLQPNQHIQRLDLHLKLHVTSESTLGLKKFNSEFE